MSDSEAPTLWIRDVVMLGGSYRSVVTAVRVDAFLQSSSCHLCLRPADARDKAMEGPPLGVGSIFRVKDNPTPFAAVKISCDNRANEELFQEIPPERKGEFIVKIHVDAVDVLEAQRQRDEESDRREFWRLSLAHLREVRGS